MGKFTFVSLISFIMKNAFYLPIYPNQTNAVTNLITFSFINTVALWCTFRPNTNTRFSPMRRFYLAIRLNFSAISVVVIWHFASFFTGDNFVAKYAKWKVHYVDLLVRSLSSPHLKRDGTKKIIGKIKGYMNSWSEQILNRWVPIEILIFLNDGVEILSVLFYLWKTLSGRAKMFIQNFPVISVVPSRLTGLLIWT